MVWMRAVDGLTLLSKFTEATEAPSIGTHPGLLGQSRMPSHTISAGMTVEPSLHVFSTVALAVFVARQTEFAAWYWHLPLFAPPTLEQALLEEASSPLRSAAPHAVTILHLVRAFGSPAVISVENLMTEPQLEIDSTTRSSFLGVAAQLCPVASTRRSFCPTTIGIPGFLSVTVLAAPASTSFKLPCVLVMAMSGPA
jgi:hypothetical protein